MKIIKFRAWNGDKMLTQDEIAFTPGISTIAFRLSNMLELLLKDYSVMQFTGLFDKNGKEIYEGDVVKDIDGSLSEIKYGKYEFGNCLGFYKENAQKDIFANNWGMSWHWEIIGNIFENPDLIK